MDLFGAVPEPRVTDRNLPDYEDLQECIRCGRCLPVCPTYGLNHLEMDSPRGRLSLLRAVEDGHLELTENVERYLYNCLDCRACNTVCPPGVHIGELIVDGRAALEKKHSRPWIIRAMLDHVLIGAARAEIVSGPLRLAQSLRLDRLGAVLLSPVPVVGRKLRELVDFAPRLSKPIRKDLARVTPAQGERRHRVAFFLGCMMNLALPDTSRATVRVLTRAGNEVVTLPNPSCCGAPQDDQGMREESRALARRNIALFEPLLDEVEAIVTDCAGCSGALKEYRVWLADDPAWAKRAARFSDKVRDVTEWLDANWPADLRLSHPPVRVAYHDPCHLANAQGVRQSPRRLLERIEGVSLVSIHDGFPVPCCGSAGIYNLTHTDASLELLDNKMDAVEETGAQVLVSANPGCQLQLAWGNRRHGNKLQVKHVVEMIDESM